MASETEVTVRGRLGNHAELQVAEGKKPWLRLRVATNRRIRNGEVWTDGPTSWYDVKVWGDFARNAAESLSKGDAVIVQGNLYIEEYTNTNGVTLRSPVIHANALGPDLRSVTARITRVHRNEPESNDDSVPAEDDEETFEPEAQAESSPVDVSGMTEVEGEERHFAPV